MRVKVGDTVFIDGSLQNPFVVARLSENKAVAYNGNGTYFPCYRLFTKGQALANALNMKIGRKYMLESTPSSCVYIARENDIFEIANGKEYDITNRLMDTPLKDVYLKRKKLVEAPPVWERIYHSNKIIYKNIRYGGTCVGTYSIV